MAETPAEAFDRGHTAGGIDERLDSHDRHFVAINGSLDRIANELKAMNLAIQRLADQSVSDAGTRVATASALEKADEARRRATEAGWVPWARVGFVITVAMAVVGVIIASR